MISTTVVTSHAVDLQAMYDQVMTDAKKSAAREATKTATKETLKTGSRIAGVTNLDAEIDTAVDTADEMIKGDPCTRATENLDPQSREFKLAEADRRIKYYQSQNISLLDARTKVETELGIKLDITSGVVPNEAMSQIKSLWQKITGN